jgi:hypothetical protein
MMFMAIDNLREIALRCRSCESLPADLSAWLGTSLNEFLSHRRRSIDDAFGITRARGGVPWWMEEAMRRRDAALRELGGRHFATLSLSAQARAIRTLALRYAASAWLRDRRAESMPAEHGGTPQELLWRAFKSGARMPIGERQLRHIMSN